MSAVEISPAISVLLPAHNAEAYVGKAIASVLGQSFREFEFHIVDDGSTDGTASEIRRAIGDDPRVRFVQQDNRGFASTLNAMLQSASGRFLARIDADDIAEPERFATQLNYFDAHPDVVVLGSAVINIDEDGDPYGVSQFPEEHERIEASLLEGTGGIIHPSVMMRREAVVSVGGYALDAPVVEDQDLWLRLASVGRLANVPDTLLRYRVHAGNMSFESMVDAARTLDKVLNRERVRRGMTPRESSDQPAVSVSDWDRRRTWTWTAVQAGNLTTARKHAWRLTRQRPWCLTGWKVALAATWPRFFDKIRGN